MMELPPPAYLQMAQAETPSEAPAVEPEPIKVNVSQYVPDNALSLTMIVSVTPPTGTAVIYAPGYEKYATIFKGPRSMEEVRLDGPIVYVKLYGATHFDIQYTNYRVP
ncbi:MAG: hypothetical protein JOY90_28810 [Bradyrhizobium sp.]|uniref:hypothetical protein n=1 Tax=Bradyrhizobium sp. TaxID=376 RepID=UPI001DEC1E3A|nr:hypothetical protein [Bradyrhizobium sp.]MBV9564410.1 hypothetical protein [Bradyrhizobium sp.]